MTLAKCKECGEKVSTKAKSCPQCGAKAPKRTPKLVWVFLALIGYLFYLGGQGNLPSSRPIASPPLSVKEQSEIESEAKIRAQKNFETETIYYAKKAVTQLLKDPESAKFKEVFFNETQKGGAVACGQVNSKNSLGAYTGFQRFISNSKTTYLEEKSSNFVDIWVEVCLPDRK